MHHILHQLKVSKVKWTYQNSLLFATWPHWLVMEYILGTHLEGRAPHIERICLIFMRIINSCTVLKNLT